MAWSDAPVHQVINHQRPARRAEQFAQADGSRWCIARVEVHRALDKFVVLDGRTGRKMTAQLGHALALMHQFDLSQAKLFAFGQVFGRFVSQVGLAECALDCLVYHLHPSSQFCYGLQ